MNTPNNLIRKRLIPNETVPLTNDRILYADHEILVTAWSALHPKPKLTSGYSCYFYHKNLKVSKFLDQNSNLLCWYCDLVTYEWKEEDTLIVTDLLADVILSSDHCVKVVDLDELSMAHEQQLLNDDTLHTVLHSLNTFLTEIYAGKFSDYTKLLEEHIK